MPRLAHHVPFVHRAEHVEESSDSPAVEGVRRWQLQQQRPEPCAQGPDFVKEGGERLARSRQATVVADRSRHLHREAEAVRY